MRGKNKSFTVDQIRAVDRFAIEQLGVPSVVLMENAGRAVAREVLRRMKITSRGHVIIVCGTGNNAGDGFVAARHLLLAGVKSRVFLVGGRKSLKGDALINFRILQRLNYPLKEIRQCGAAFLKEISVARVVVDAIFGTGLNREITGFFKGIIQGINRKARYVVSVDVPSGLNATTGEIYGIAVKAGTTVTFIAVKKGFLKKEGLRYTGKVVVADIGVPPVVPRRV